MVRIKDWQQLSRGRTFLELRNRAHMLESSAALLDLLSSRVLVMLLML